MYSSYVMSMQQMTFNPGQIVEITSFEYDDLGGCVAEVLEDKGHADVLVYVKAKTDYWVPRSRLTLGKDGW